MNGVGLSFTSNEFVVFAASVPGAELPNAGIELCVAVIPPKIPADCAPPAPLLVPKGLIAALLALPNNDGVASAGFAAPNGLLLAIPLPNVDTGADAPKAGAPLAKPPNSDGVAAVGVEEPKFALEAAPNGELVVFDWGSLLAPIVKGEEDGELPKGFAGSLLAAIEPKANCAFGASLTPTTGLANPAVAAEVVPKAIGLIADRELLLGVATTPPAGLPNTGAGDPDAAEFGNDFAPNVKDDAPNDELLLCSFAAGDSFEPKATPPNTGELIVSIFFGASVAVADPNIGTLVEGLLPKAKFVEVEVAAGVFFSSSATDFPDSPVAVSLFFTSIVVKLVVDEVEVVVFAAGAPNANPPGDEEVAEIIPNLNPPIGVIFSATAAVLLSAAVVVVAT